MTSITPRRTQYALRAVFELAKHQGSGPTKIFQIAAAQSIPAPFLEVILHRLKGSGIIAAKRGFNGGYFLTRPPDQITVADIMGFLQAPATSADCSVCRATQTCPHGNRCAFSAMWNRVNRAITQVYTETTIQDLLDNDRQLQGKKSGSRKRSPTKRRGRSL